MAKRGQVTRGEIRDDDERPVRWRRYYHLFLIVCEDSKTEPYYFEKFKDLFPPETLFLRTVGTGQTWDDVVNRALNECNDMASEAGKHIDEVWAVFDVDDANHTSAGTLKFNSALEIAKKNKIKIAFSNEVFELWLLLHFMDVTANHALPRADIYSMLETKIRKHPAYSEFVYEHGKTEIIDVLLKIGNEPKAIERASILYEQKKDQAPIKSNPNTSTHILVIRLRELLEYYSRTN